MDTGQVTELMREAMYVALMLAAPILLISVLIGLVISIIQAATQIHEQTLTFVPKLVGISLILIMLGPWMITQLSDFADKIFQAMVTFS